MADATVDVPTGGAHPAEAPDRAPRIALVVVWSRSEPHRVGHVALLAPGSWELGRGDGDGARCRFGPQRPGEVRRGAPLEAATLSRRQLVLDADEASVRIENVGRRALRHQGWPVTACEAVPGDLVEIEDELLLLVERRPAELPDTTHEPHPWGEPDAHGLVGEAPATWELRRQIRFVGPRDAHVLLLGPSGCGKELVAQAIHALSPRGRRRLVARNAATFPDTLVDAELFGHAANYPNHGMPDRGGLVGEADGSTLFLDEIGEMPQPLQAHLLRLLDSGEYVRLGESRPRRSDLRLIAATNREPEALKHDFRARMPLTLRLPGLDERRADVPLLARHVVRRIARRDPDIGARFLDEAGRPRLTARLVAALVQRPWATHVRELEALLWGAMLHATGPVLDETDAVRFVPGREERAPVPTDIPREALEESLRRHDGVREKVWRDLGLSSRHQLARLLKRHGLDA